MTLRGLPFLVSALAVLCTNTAVAGGPDQKSDAFISTASSPIKALAACKDGGSGSGGSGSSGGGSGSSGGGSGSSGSSGSGSSGGGGDNASGSAGAGSGGGGGAAGSAASSGGASGATSSASASGNAISTTNFGTADGAGNLTVVRRSIGANGANAGGAVAISGVSLGDDRSAAALRPPASRLFTLQAIYFRRESFKNTADCLTAAYSQQLPLEVCR